MNTQKLLIISVIAALLIIGGAVAFVKFKNAVPTAPASGAQADHVVVDEIMSSCTTKDDCIVVDTKCSFCCDYVAINAKSEILYNEMFDKTCKNYSGTYCQCHDLSSYPSCVNGQCQMVKWTESKPLRAPPVQAPVPQAAPVIAPAPAPINTSASPAPLDAPIDPQRQTPQPAENTLPDAFGDEPAIQDTPPAPAVDDLYAPLPDDYQPEIIDPHEDNAVHVIQP